MCGRYFIEDDGSAAELWRIVSALTPLRGITGVKTGEVFPTDTAPVIANSKRLEPAPFAMRWGYALGGGKLMINARSETAAGKPLFADGMARRRCLVPASWYFEWEKRGDTRIKYQIAPAKEGPLYMAGVYRLIAGRAEFVILTRAPAPGIAFIHNRMPVILPREAQALWLNPACAPGEALERACLDMEAAAV